MFKMQPTVRKVILNVLGIRKGKYCNIIKKGAQRSIALTVVRICVICQSQKFDANAMYNCQKCFDFCVTKPVHTALTKPLLTTSSFVHSKMH